MRKKTNGIDSDDISGGQSTGNYTYDLIGNLISDNVEGINNITWNVYGKISSIDKASGPDLTFAYDPMGNRIMKLVDDGSTLIYTYYVRDAQGNVLSTYSRIDDATDDIITLSELHIYGSSRLGIMVEELDMSTTITSDGHSQRNLGKKRYELNNHLGNVLTVITDRRFGTEQGTTGLIKYYEADVLQAQDYYPFGMLTPGRNWSAGSEYRFGFGGQEKDDEVYGNGNLNTALFWEYDTRLGRRWNVDPVVNPYKSPYATFENNPIYFTDIHGDTEDGPGGRKAEKRAEKKIDHLNNKGYNAWIADQDDNDNRIDIAFTGANKNGEYFVGGSSVKLSLFNKISNSLSKGDAWVHSDAGEQFGQEVANFFPGTSAGHIINGVSEGTDMYGNQMEGSDYFTYGLNIVPTPISSENVSIVLRAAKPSIKFLNSSELANRLKTSQRNYHKVIKPKMKKYFTKEMRELGTTNPDFTPDSFGNIVLRNPESGLTKSTNIPLTKFKRND
ncbi:MAG: hypothetical protein IPG60_01620 [Bacteroidetes bacterium]|nr:hypothetical protein [Bacteroidota bacterium]